MLTNLSNDSTSLRHWLYLVLAECERSHVCRQRLYFAKGWRVWRERRNVRNSVGAATSAGKILLPTNVLQLKEVAD